MGDADAATSKCLEFGLDWVEGGLVLPTLDGITRPRVSLRQLWENFGREHDLTHNQSQSRSTDTRDTLVTSLRRP